MFTKDDGKPKNLFTRIRALLRPDPFSTALLVSTFLLVLFYRIGLTYALLTRPIRPFDYTPSLHPFGFTLRYLFSDFGLVALTFGVSWFVGRLGSWLGYEKKRAARFVSHVFFHLLLVALVLTHGVHGRLLFDGQTGLDLAAIREGLANVSPLLLVRLIEPRDLLLLLVPIGVFWFVLLCPPSVRWRMTRVSIVFMALLAIGSGLATSAQGRDATPAELRTNPAFFLLRDLANRTLHQERIPNQESSDVERRKPHAAALTKVPEEPRKPFPPPHTSGPWNVVFIVLESVGSRYVFDTDGAQPMPMPFLYELAGKGWFLKNHFSTSNLSTKALFSLMSGLYDLFRQESFGLRSEAVVPSLYSLVPANYHSFLVTPAPLSWFFPGPFVKNTGPTRIYSYENLKLPTREERHQSLGRYVARDEVETIDFFIEKLSGAKEPFLATYVSFVAHFPYFDYGPDYEVRPKDGRLVHRYYNNLRLLDQMIHRIYRRLEKDGKLNRTILVIVGDHGQAFGQHRPDNFMHFRYSYNENLQAPAIFWQPTVFLPKVFQFPTSHVDILPTLLEAMNVSHDPAPFDGESLFQASLKRNHIFSYGHEGTITSLSRDGIKVQYSLKRDRCWAFDLAIDPNEESPLSCDVYQAQLEALQAFARHHDVHLIAYNGSFLERRGTPSRSTPPSLPP